MQSAGNSHRRAVTTSIFVFDIDSYLRTKRVCNKGARIPLIIYAFLVVAINPSSYEKGSNGLWKLNILLQILVLR